MAGRKAEDDVMARGAAEAMMADLFDINAGEQIRDGLTSGDVISRFKTVQFEEGVSKLRGEEIPVRRIVAVTEWQVDPNRVR